LELVARLASHEPTGKGTHRPIADGSPPSTWRTSATPSASGDVRESCVRRAGQHRRGDELERAAAIDAGSGSNVTDYVAHDGSNNAAISADVSDPAAMQAILASPSPELAATMEEHGVVPPLSVLHRGVVQHRFR
jgi:hypothetical protein